MRTHSPKRPKRRRGLTLAEVAVSSLLVGMVLVGSMRCLRHTIRGRTDLATQTLARHLAQQLMAEICNTAYKDEGLVPLHGPELGESTANRSAFDDVDDYHNWSESPPQDRNGAALANLSGWQRSVTVDLVQAANPAQPVLLLDEGVKRITVTVSRNNKVLARRVALRSKSYVAP